MLACIKIAAATAVGWGLFGTTWHVAGMGSGTAPTRLASKGQSCSRFGGKYHSPLVRRNEMESTSGTPLGTLRLGRQRPSVWCYYSGRIEHRDIIGLGKSSKFQWSWWGSQTQNENTGICIFYFFFLSVSPLVLHCYGKNRKTKSSQCTCISFLFLLSLSHCVVHLSFQLPLLYFVLPSDSNPFSICSFSSG